MASGSVDARLEARCAPGPSLMDNLRRVHPSSSILCIFPSTGIRYISPPIFTFGAPDIRKKRAETYCGAPDKAQNLIASRARAR